MAQNNRPEFMTVEYTHKISEIIKFEINTIKNKLYKRDLEMEDTLLMMGPDANIQYEPVENENVSLVERQKLKSSLEKWNKYSTMYPIDVYDDLVGNTKKLVKQLEKEHKDAVEKLKTATSNLATAENQLKLKKKEYANLTEDTYESNKVDAAQAKKIPELKKLVDSLNRSIPGLRSAYQAAKEPEVLVVKNLEAAKKELIILEKRFQPNPIQSSKSTGNYSNDLTTIVEETPKLTPKCWLCDDGECTCD